MSQQSVAPDPNYVIARAADDSLSWRTALSELIDNALDAGARNVRIVFRPQHVAVVDDGKGAADLLPFATLGGRASHSSTAVGRYGIGAKEAAIWMGGAKSRFTVQSVHGGKARSLTADWAAMIASRQWLVDEIAVLDAQPGEIGTRVAVTPLQKRIPEGSAMDDLRTELGYMYSPAIKRGAQISIQSKKMGSTPEPLQRWELPLFEGILLREELRIAGKLAILHAGIVQNGQHNSRPGISYVHAFRVIQRNSPAGCGNYSTARIAGCVELDSSWRLSKNKTSFDGADGLYREVERVLTPLLKRAEQAALQSQSEALNLAVESLLNAALGGSPDRKAKRGPGESSGTHQPTGTGRKHKRAKRDQPGSTFIGHYGHMRIEWHHLERIDDIGDVAGAVVRLNSANPTMARLRDQGNVDAIFFAAATIVQEAELRQSGQLKFDVDGFDDVRLTRMIGKMLARQTHVEDDACAATPMQEQRGG